MEQRKSYKNAKGNVQLDQTSMRQNTDVLYDGGLSRSSDEVSVMGVERRAEVVQLETFLPPRKGRSKEDLTKSVPITQFMVLSAFNKVQKNKGSAGIDRVSLKEYKERRSDNLYLLWNRMSSGSYQVPPVLEAVIPKDNGKKRYLGVPTVNDRTAQQVVKNYLEPRFEKLFHENSYGYRPRKSPHQALAEVQKNVRKYGWVVDMDISGFFDNVSHKLLNKALERHVTEKWVLMYINRWLSAPSQDKDENIKLRAGKGTPQGGVISPLLANLFLHYALDEWLKRNHPDVRFVRYADDVVIHCQSQQQAEYVLRRVKERLLSCELSVNEEKTKIVFCKTENRRSTYKIVKFDFLGYSFQPRTTTTKEGKLFLGYNCAISHKSEQKIAKKLRESNFHRKTNNSIGDIARMFNSQLRGWIYYYGKFRQYELRRVFKIFNKRLLKWALRRHKRFKKSRVKARRWILGIATVNSNLFVHWQCGFATA